MHGPASLCLLLFASLAWSDVLPPAPGIASVLSTPFDYVIAGGGTAGLTLAVLLTENPSTNVLVLDRGTYRPNDTTLQAPGLWTAELGNPLYDYVLLSVPQASANNSVIEFSRGKTLGGTSALNSMVYMPPSKHEFDPVYTIFGNANWTWDNFMAFARQSENFTVAESQFLQNDNAQQDPSLHGQGGPLSVTYANFFPDLVPLYFETMNALGVQPNKDPRAAGTNVGSFSATINVDPRTNERSYAASAFYEPNKGRTNLVVVTEAQVTKVLFSDADASGNVTATGVQFLFANSTQTVNATKSVIVASGVMFTPQILELSGIGNKTLLQSFGITSVVDLPGVGENMQEHWAFNPGSYLKQGTETFDQLRDPTFAAEQLTLYTQNHTGLLSAGETAVTFVPITNYINSSVIEQWQQQISDELPSLNPGQQAQFRIISGFMNDSLVAWAEVFPQFEWSGEGVMPAVTDPVISFTTLMEHPLSRGSIHINSSDPTVLPLIDPQIYSHPIDKELALTTIKWIRASIANTPPLSNNITGAMFPAANATDDELFMGIVQTVLTGHTIGTAAMMPREWNGVVDPDLKVYGTNNLFIVDTSVMPMEVSAHLDIFAYTFAYRTAAFLQGNSVTPSGPGNTSVPSTPSAVSSRQQAGLLKAVISGVACPIFVYLLSVAI